MDSNQILTNDKDLQVLLVLKMRPTNPAAILKNAKSPYICNHLTDFD